MYTLLTILIVIISILIILVVLIQNPKGGGLGGTFGGVSANTLGGARKAGNFLDRLTWGLIIGLLVFSLASIWVIPNKGGTSNVNGNQQIEEKILDYDPNNFNPNPGDSGN